MSKTKFIKVSVEERLPQESGPYSTEMGNVLFSTSLKQFLGYNGKTISIDWWCEEVPDREEEMREILEECRLQLEHLNNMKQRGTTNSVLGKLKKLLDTL